MRTFTFFYLLIFLGFTEFCFAQKEQYNWYFGNNAAISFNTNPPTPVTGSVMNAFEGSASISDANGNLLFYTNGISVWNKNNQTMPNGNNTLLANPSSTQSALILPLPGSSTIYYVFTIDALSGNGLCYDIVDMSLDGGLGDVVLSQHQKLLNNTPEKMTAVSRCNNTGGFDYWFITHLYSNVFNAYLLTSTGLNTTPVQSAIGLVHTFEMGYLRCSPDGTKLAVALQKTPTGDAFEVFDFDKNTGLVSNDIQLCTNCPQAYGIEFSPNGKLVYGTGVNQQTYIYQFNLMAGSPAAVIASMQNISVGVPSTMELGALQLGPDGRIYLAEFNGFGNSNAYLGVINTPNSLGLSSNFNVNGLYLGTYGSSQTGLPNFDPSQLGFLPTDTSICLGNNSIIGPYPVATSSYVWTPTTGFIGGSIATTPNPTVSPTTTTTYIVNITDASSCTASNQVVVKVLNDITANAGSNQTICAGGSANIGSTAVAGNRYSWLPTTGLNNATVANPMASPTTSTTYVVTVTSSGGCSASSQVIVSVKPLPVVDAGNDTTICTGSTITLNGTINASYTYQWSALASLSNTTIARPLATPTVTTTYYLTVTENGCSNKDSVIITVSKPIANAGPDQVICAGNSTIIGTTRQSGYTYQWAPATGLNNDTTAMPSANPTVTTTYIVTVTGNSIGNINLAQNGSLENATLPSTSLTNVSFWSDPIQPNLFAYPSDYFSGTTSTVPANNYGTMPAEDGIAYAAISMVIYPGYLLAAPMQSYVQNELLHPLKAGTTYQIVFYAALGNDTTTTNVAAGYIGVCFRNYKVDTILSGNNLPYATAYNNPSMIINSSTWTKISFNYTANGTENYVLIGDFSYFTPYQPIAKRNNEFDAHYYIDNLSIKEVNTATCTAVDTVVVSVLSNIPVDAGNDTTICIASQLLFHPTLNANYTYQWAPAASLNNPNIAQPTATLSTTTTYYLTVTENGCSNTDSIVIHVAPLSTANAGVNQTICEGNSVTLGASTVAGYTYAWSPAAGLSTTTGAMPMANPTITTTYSLTVTDTPTGCSNTSQAIVTVNPLPQANAGRDTLVCSGNSVILGMQVQANCTYSWNPSTGLNNSNISNPVATPTITTTYVLTATNTTTSCTNTAQVAISVQSLPQADAGADQTICAGGSAAIGSVSNPLYTYNWFPSAGLSNVNISNPIASPTTNTTYTVSMSNNGCSSTDQVVISIALQDISLTPSFQRCTGDTITLNTNGNPSYTYAWQPTTGLNNSQSAKPLATPTVTTTYTVTVTQQIQGGGSCNVVVSTVVNVSSLQILVNTPKNLITCENEPITLSAQSNAQGSRYIFSTSMRFSDTLNTSTHDSVFTLIPTQTKAIYYVMAYNQYCKAIDSITYTADTIRVHTNPLITCIAQVDTINITQQSPSALHFKWNDDATIIGTDTLPQLIIKTAANTTYYATVSNQRGCTSLVSVAVSLGNRVNAHINTTKNNITKEESVVLQASPTGSNYQYQWISSNGEITNTKSDTLTASPKLTTTYYLEVTDLQNPQTCIGRDTIVITVHFFVGCEPKSVFIASGFSPNGDGNNDVLYVRSNSIKDIQFLIFDRWGEKLREITNLADGWDGTYNEKPVEEGVYVYYLKYTCTSDGLRYLKTGNVTVVR